MKTDNVIKQTIKKRDELVKKLTSLKKELESIDDDDLNSILNKYPFVGYKS